MARRAATMMAVTVFLLGLPQAGPAMAAPADCFADYGGVVEAGEVVPGNLRVTRQAPGSTPPVSAEEASAWSWGPCRAT
jgi:hypothetical protein